MAIWQWLPVGLFERLPIESLPGPLPEDLVLLESPENHFGDPQYSLFGTSPDPQMHGEGIGSTPEKL